MPVVTTQEALQLLTSEVEKKLSPEELLEVHHELFPDESFTQKEADDNPLQLIEAIVDRLNSGLAAEEVVDLWGLIAPKHRNIWYDEEADRIHYNEQPAPQTAE